MIFCGDIALAVRNGIKLIIPDFLKEKKWIANLEGSLISPADLPAILKRHVVFNNTEALKDLMQQIPLEGFNLANNHLFDAGNLKQTIDNLHLLKVRHVGAGYDLKEAAKSLSLQEEGIDFEIFSFGWEGIQCKYATLESDGVNPYTKKHVIKTVENALSHTPNKKIICLFHWNYELELYPQPLDRELCHQLIDKGVHAIIGCHAHRVQGIEWYKGHPIVYGLGNFLFQQGVYMNGRLSFPSFCDQEMAFEVHPDGNFSVHWFVYDKGRSTVSFKKTEKINGSKNAPFAQMSNAEYKQWIKCNRYHKNKLLPLFYYNDSVICNKNKIFYVKYMRHQCILLAKRILSIFK